MRQSGHLGSLRLSRTSWIPTTSATGKISKRSAVTRKDILILADAISVVVVVSALGI